ncbi:single-stranded DNA-binding protein [Sphingobacterium corticibacter]|uniref:Single-stranded DNA-binding protein n=1 Tax=Sphingobacterium corticibacter TaxID=2171749 RepID=A0A2T8HJH7_9SPHI|nr:single-stranded DNA-binding protein [Sphingobacterium corticibacter]PVH25555.1 single-stranded DNA-binding protein [Sphingobacterium corticibacter]
MASVNKVILVGHLGKDPEIRYLDGNVSVASFPLATSEFYNKDGKKVEQTEWHNIVLWRALADLAVKYLKKGKLVYIEGKLRTRTYEDKEGVRRFTTEIVAESFNLLGRRSDFEPQSGERSSDRPEDQPDEEKVDFRENDDDNDGLPF